jgi:hypothetical protein
MEEHNEIQPAATGKNNLHRLARKGALLSKFLLVLFIVCLAVTATWKFVAFPYSIFVVGLEIALAIMSASTIIRMNTFRPAKPYNFEKLKQQKEPINLLLTNINYDIARYEEGSSYFFNGVRIYKYSTILLAGISTIILGIDLSEYGEFEMFGGMSYTIFAKNLALVIGAIITVSTTLMTYWNIEKYWLQNKTMVNKLRALKDDIEGDFVAGKLNDAGNLQEKIDGYKKIKGDFYKYWEGALSDRGSGGQANTNNNG